MKRIIFTYILSFCFFLTIHSQVEIKSDVIRLLDGEINMASEFLINPWWAISVGLGTKSEKSGIRDVNIYTQQTFNLMFTPKYYFAPGVGNDRFFLGGYWILSRRNHQNANFGLDEIYVEKRNAFGLMIGHKWISPTGFFIDFVFGGGVKSVNRFYEKTPNQKENNVDGHWIGQIQFGYRFGGKELYPEFNFLSSSL